MVDNLKMFRALLLPCMKDHECRTQKMFDKGRDHIIKNLNVKTILFNKGKLKSIIASLNNDELKN